MTALVLLLGTLGPVGVVVALYALVLFGGRFVVREVRWLRARYRRHRQEVAFLDK